MIIKCNRCLSEYEVEFEVVDKTVYNCEVCNNIQILDGIVWKNITKEQLEDFYISKIVECRLREDDGTRYTLEDVRKYIKNRKQN